MDLPVGLTGSGPTARGIKPQFFSQEMWVFCDLALVSGFRYVDGIMRWLRWGRALTPLSGSALKPDSPWNWWPPTPQQEGLHSQDPNLQELAFPDSTVEHLGPTQVSFRLLQKSGHNGAAYFPWSLGTGFLGGQGLGTLCPSAHGFQPAQGCPWLIYSTYYCSCHLFQPPTGWCF